jgi:FMN reductase
MRVPSLSLSVCRSAAAVGKEFGFSTRILDLRELALPIYVPDWELGQYPAGRDQIHQLVESLRVADALIWASPTYHGTVSGVFKNAVDFTELLCRDVRPYLYGRSVGLVSINDSTTFAAMRDCARELRAWLAPTQVELGGGDFNHDHELVGESATRRLRRLLQELAEFVTARPVA